MLRLRGIVHPAPFGIIGTGPRVDVVFSIHPADAQAYLEKGQAPPAVQGSLLIDTGAESTLVDDGIPTNLGLTPIRFQPIMFGDGRPQDRPVYRMSIMIAMEDDAGRPHKGSWVGDVVGMDAAKQGHGGLMGRDFLRHFRFQYDGRAGTFELASDGDRDPAIKAARAQERHEKKKRRGNRRHK